MGYSQIRMAHFAIHKSWGTLGLLALCETLLAGESLASPEAAELALECIELAELAESESQFVMSS
jgi:hypothetical protein